MTHSTIRKRFIRLIWQRHDDTLEFHHFADMWKPVIYRPTSSSLNRFLRVIGALHEKGEYIMSSDFNKKTLKNCVYPRETLGTGLHDAVLSNEDKYRISRGFQPIDLDDVLKRLIEAGYTVHALEHDHDYHDGSVQLFDINVWFSEHHIVKRENLGYVIRKMSKLGLRPYNIGKSWLSAEKGFGSQAYIRNEDETTLRDTEQRMAMVGIIPPHELENWMLGW